MSAGPALPAGGELGVGHFAQWLEGPEEAVRDLSRRISADPRHEDCETTAEGPTGALVGRDARLFPHWSMALERPSTLPFSVEAFLAYYLAYAGEIGLSHPLRRQRSA